MPPISNQLQLQAWQQSNNNNYHAYMLHELENFYLKWRHVSWNHKSENFNLVITTYRGLMNIPVCCGTKVFNIKMMSRDDGVNIIHAYFQNLQELYLCKITSKLKCWTRNFFDSFLLWLVRIMHREIYFLCLNSKCHSARQLKFSTQILHPCRSPTTKSDVSRKKIF